MTDEQQDIEGVPVEYARPPESKPAERDRTPDRLALLATDYNDAQRSGIIEGALWACRRFLEMSPLGPEATAVEIEEALRHRFGAEPVNREKRLREPAEDPSR